MKKKIIFVFAVLFSLNFYAQVNFEKGYFITNSNTKVECYIRNSDWRDNPTRFVYKTSENESSTDEKNASDVKEFGIGEYVKFERFEGLVDDSSFNLNQMSDHKEPTWIKKTIFLKVIIQGNAKLYSYVDGNTTKYFYSNNGSPVEQLVYKKYAEDNVTIKTNNFFQQQLYTKVKCESVPLSEIFKIKYTEEDLSNYFLKANNSSADKKDLVATKTNGVKIEDRRDKSKKGNVLFRAKAGMNFNSLDVTYNINDIYGRKSPSNPDVAFDGAQTYKLGFDVEYVLASNRNKWSVFFDFGFQNKYEAEKTFLLGDYPFAYEKHYHVSYSCVDLGLGVRYYMFLNNNSKLFLNMLLQESPSLNANFQAGKDQLTFRAKPYFGFGFGYGYKRYNLEFRYSSRNILADYYNIKSNYQDLSITLGYTLFENNKKN